MTKTQRLFFGLGLVFLAFLIDYIPVNNNQKIDNEYAKYLTLTKPSDTIYQEVKDIKSIVSGPDEVFDRELIAIFNNEMAKRLETYNGVNTLAFENYYYDAGKMYFEGRIAKKYAGLGDKLYQIILSTLGDNETVISKDEFAKLSEKMKGIAWVLLN